MSDKDKTPRTNAAELPWSEFVAGAQGKTAYVHSDEMRKLEKELTSTKRELNEAKALNARLHNEYMQC